MLGSWVDTVLSHRQQYIDYINTSAYPGSESSIFPTNSLEQSDWGASQTPWSARQVLSTSLSAITSHLWIHRTVLHYTQAINRICITLFSKKKTGPQKSIPQLDSNIQFTHTRHPTRTLTQLYTGPNIPTQVSLSSATGQYLRHQKYIVLGRLSRRNHSWNVFRNFIIRLSSLHNKMKIPYIPHLLNQTLEPHWLAQRPDSWSVLHCDSIRSQDIRPNCRWAKI